MQSQERDKIEAFLEGTVSAGASSQEVAEVVVAAFQSIEQVLVPIVGGQGMAALYKRSSHLTLPAHPWLPVTPTGVASQMDLAALQTALTARSAAQAAAAGTRLLQTFHELLTGLIGKSLTERLLRPVFATFLSGPSARSTQP